MTPDKQALVLQILSNGKYMVNVEDGGIYSRRNGKFELLAPTILKTGFLQYHLFLGRGKSESIRIYGHCLVWLSVHGRFSPKDKITHISGCRTDNGINNLIKKEWFQGVPKVETAAGIKPIREEEINKIKYLVEMGEVNHSEIARQLGLNRSSVRRTVIKIQKGEQLKYEKKN